MDTAKIRVKIGVHEFEAEGPAAQVAEQFTSWKDLIAAIPSSDNLAKNTPPPPHEDQLSGLKAVVDSIQKERLGHLFNSDDKRDIVTLRSLPTGEDRHRESVLLVLYGFLRLKGADEVGVTKLKSALESSGSAPDRIDRVASPSVRDGFLVKGGSGKGGRYRLTNKGIAKAEEMVHERLQLLT